MIYFLKCVLYLYHDVNSQEVSMYALHLTENIWKKQNKIGNAKTSFENNIVNDLLCAVRFIVKISK